MASMMSADIRAIPAPIIGAKYRAKMKCDSIVIHTPTVAELAKNTKIINRSIFHLQRTKFFDE